MVFGANAVLFWSNTSVFGENTSVFGENTAVFVASIVVFVANTVVFGGKYSDILAMNSGILGQILWYFGHIQEDSGRKGNKPNLEGKN